MGIIPNNNQLFQVYDVDHNCIAMDDNGVYLKLNRGAHSKFRRIIAREGNILTKTVPRENIMRKDNTVVFCLEALLLLVEKKFTHITMIVEDYGTFILKIDDIIKDGKPNQYAQQGFEKQIFYPLGD